MQLVFQLHSLPDNGSGTRVLLKMYMDGRKRIINLKNIPSFFVY